jgi:pantoate--beta-alanine ligase
VQEIYPDGFATTVSVPGRLTETLEGEHRGRAHFDGVATVVVKLLNMAQPDVAFFGQKDAQQAVVIGRVVRDLDLPVRIELVPTVREGDGLALSSRNVHLRGSDRRRALALQAGLGAARALVTAGELDARVIAAAGRDAMRARGVEPEYLAVVDPDTLAPLAAVDGTALIAVAARIGPTRLIDNVLIEPAEEER